MHVFWAAFALFFLSHGLIARGKLRETLVARLGERRYLALYSLVSLILLTWLIMAARDAPRTDLWVWRHEFYWLPNILMPLACILLTAGFIVPNPLSIAPKEAGFSPEKPGLIVATTRHPVLWGFFLWSFSHILPNGEYPLAFLFLTFSIFSLLGLGLLDRKRKRQLGLAQWTLLSRQTSSFFLASPALWRGQFTTTRRDIYGIGLGLVLFVLLYGLHEIFFQIRPTPPL